MPKYPDKAPLWVCIVANTISIIFAIVAVYFVGMAGQQENFVDLLLWILCGIMFGAIPTSIEFVLEKKYTSPENYQRYKDSWTATYMKVLKYTILAPFYIIAAAYMVFFHKTFK